MAKNTEDIASKKIATMSAKLLDPNLSSKSKAATRKNLAKLATSNPDQFTAAGLSLDDFPGTRTEVSLYGCIGRIVMLDHTGSVVPVSYADIMKAKHEYYNMLLSASSDIHKEAISLLKGPKWVEAEQLQAKLDDAHDSKNKLNYTLTLVRPSPAEKEKMKEDLLVLTDKISALNTEKSALKKDLWEEIKAMRKLHKTELAALISVNAGTRLGAVVNATRKLVGPGPKSKTPKEPHFRNSVGASVFLRDGDYAEVEEDMRRSYEASLEADWVTQAVSHYKYENKPGVKPAFSVFSYDRWDGEGKLSIQMPQTDRRTVVVDAIEGTSKWFKVRPLVVSDLAVYGLSKTFLDVDNRRKNHIRNLEAKKQASPSTWTAVQDIELQRLQDACAKSEDSQWMVAYLQADPLTWTTVVCKLHRPLSENLQDKVARVRVIRKKIGLKMTTSLHVTIVKQVQQDTAPKVDLGEVVLKPTVVETAPGVYAATIVITNPTKTLSYTMPKVKYVDKSTGAKCAVPMQSLITRMSALEKHLKEHYRLSVENLKTLVWEHPHTDIPADFFFNSRSSQRFAFRKWVEYLRITTPDADSLLKGIRKLVREQHQQTKGTGGDYGSSYQGTHALVVDEAMEAFRMKRSAAEVFACLLLFVERYDHLYPWSVSLRERVLNLRREHYRVLASKLVAVYGSIKVEKEKTPYNEPEEKRAARRLLCASDLETVLENAASRAGRKFRCS